MSENLFSHNTIEKKFKYLIRLGCFLFHLPLLIFFSHSIFFSDFFLNLYKMACRAERSLVKLVTCLAGGV